jgi:hypothetical protein
MRVEKTKHAFCNINVVATKYFNIFHWISIDENSVCKGTLFNDPKLGIWIWIHAGTLPKTVAALLVALFNAVNALNPP